MLTDVAKYDPLRAWLSGASHPVVVSFEALDRLVDGLPPSAFVHRSWWANDRSHVEAVAWIEAGRTVDAVNLRERWVRFS
jgi:hypothetical protein